VSLQGAEQLVLERMRCTYWVPSGHPSPESVRARLDPLLAERVPTACARLLRDQWDEDDPSIWYVRNVEVELDLDMDVADDERLARAWAESLAAALMRRMAAGTDRDDMVRFPDAASYLAQFVADLADGRAWDHWYYARLDGLKPLPLGAAIREAFMREPALAKAALRVLVEMGRLEGVMALLSESEARSLYLTTFHNLPRRSPGRPLVELLLKLWPRASSRDGEASSAKHAIRVLALLWTEAPSVEVDGSAMVGLELLQAAANAIALASQPSSLPAPLGALVGLAEMRELKRLAGNDLELVATVLKAIGAQPISKPQASTARFVSAFGGVFLLLPSLLRLALAPVSSNALDSDGQARRRAEALRVLVLLKCLGASRAKEALWDPGLRLAAGCPDGSIDDLQSLAETGSAEQRSELLLPLMGALNRLGRADGKFVAVDLLNEDQEDSLLLIRDVMSGAWLFLAPATAGTRGSVTEEGLGLIRQAFGQEPEVLVNDLTGVSGVEPSILEKFLAYPRPVGPELDYIDLRPLLGSGLGSFDATLSVISHAVIREFAVRLGGFERASAAHLYRNFLDVPAVVEETEGGIEAELDAPTLGIVLRMAGLHAQTYRVGWLGDRSVTVSIGAG
jgi:hypothetical protein